MVAGSETKPGRGWARQIARKAAILWRVATDRRLSWAARAPAMLALAYVASPIDLIPDMLPGVGWLDDLLVLALGASISLRLVPKDLLAEHLARTEPEPVPGLPEEAVESAGMELAALSWLLIIVGAVLATAAIVAAGLDLPLLGESLLGG